MTDRWDAQADIVVIGFGGAGGAAAVTAADLGASVIILEKQSENAHTPSTSMATTSIMVSVSDADQATRYFDRCAGGLIPEAVSRAWAQKALVVQDWIRETLDLPIEPQYEPHAQHPSFEGAESIEVFRSTPEGSASGGLMGSLKRGVTTRGIKVLWDSPAHRLIQDDSGRVIGVETTGGGGTKRIGATKGVILSCGGFEYDEDLKRNYLKAFPIYFYGNPGNTGDGIRMAQAVGADLWHMNLMFGRAIAHFELDADTPVNTLADLSPAQSNPWGPDQGDVGRPVGYVLTDKLGRRFANEAQQTDIIQHMFHFELFDFDLEARDYIRIPCYWFFDQRRVDNGPLTRAGSGRLVHTWSDDNQAEVALGWVHRADTLEELAASLGMPDPAVAAKEIAGYNAACATGEDSWGRPVDTLIPLDSPPYYAMPLYPGGPSTCGGPRRNEHGQVLDPFGEPIPGLFAAGELGAPFGLLYPHHGSHLTECVAFGQISAESAVAGR